MLPETRQANAMGLSNYGSLSRDNEISITQNINSRQNRRGQVRNELKQSGAKIITDPQPAVPIASN